MDRGICKGCKFTAVCLPSAAPVAYAIVFEKAAKQFGLPTAISKFELMPMRGSNHYLVMLGRVYNMTCDKVPCHRPHIRVETNQRADILEVKLRFSKGARIGFKSVQELHTFRHLFDNYVR